VTEKGDWKKHPWCGSHELSTFQEQPLYVIVLLFIITGNKQATVITKCVSGQH